MGDLERRFRDAPAAGKEEQCRELRELTYQLSRRLVALCPFGHERTVALRKLEEVVMWGNLAIARNGNHSSERRDEE